MNVARHGTGLRATGRALASQIHPVFMLPPVAASVFGAVLARDIEVGLAAVHVVAAFSALYTAHVKDGYVDFYLRGEDDDHPLTRRGCGVALAGATTVFALATAVIAVAAGPTAAALTVPGWVVGYLHAPHLDLHPVTATAGYPVGIVFALVGGHYVQTRTLSTVVLAFAAVFLVVLSGIKIVDDAKDYDYDRSISKRTVAVVLGPAAARRTAYGLMASGMVGVVLLTALGVFPASAVGGVVVFGGVALVARRATDRVATMLLIRGTYLFLAALVVAVWFRPLS
jgi:1,4-dihydroxy-2-naphthoate octaprenyltransferase